MGTGDKVIMNMGGVARSVQTNGSLLRCRAGCLGHSEPILKSPSFKNVRLRKYVMFMDWGEEQKITGCHVTSTSTPNWAIQLTATTVIYLVATLRCRTQWYLVLTRQKNGFFIITLV